MQLLPKPTILMVQKSQLFFFEKLGDDVILVQCPFNNFLFDLSLQKFCQNQLDFALKMADF